LPNQAMKKNVFYVESLKSMLYGEPLENLKIDKIAYYTIWSSVSTFFNVGI
jgi:hypothetical protein